MLSPPRHLILPSHLSGVRVTLHSILHLPFGLWLHFTHCLLGNFVLHGDVTITGERLQNLGLCSALRAFEQGGIFIVSPAVTQDLGFSGLNRRTTPIRSPHATHKWMFKFCVTRTLKCSVNHHSQGQLQLLCI
jgi:hypothetical protein